MTFILFSNRYQITYECNKKCGIMNFNFSISHQLFFCSPAPAYRYLYWFLIFIITFFPGLFISRRLFAIHLLTKSIANVNKSNNYSTNSISGDTVHIIDNNNIFFYYYYNCCCVILWISQTIHLHWKCLWRDCLCINRQHRCTSNCEWCGVDKNENA